MAPPASSVPAPTTPSDDDVVLTVVNCVLAEAGSWRYDTDEALVMPPHPPQGIGSRCTLTTPSGAPCLPTTCLI